MRTEILFILTCHSEFASSAGKLARKDGLYKTKTRGPSTSLMRHRFQMWFIITAHKRSLGQGNIFRSVCQEFCPQGGGSASVHAGILPPPEQGPPRDQAPPQIRHPPRPGTPLDQTPPPSRTCWEIRSTSGRYASYWNAILFGIFFCRQRSKKIFYLEFNLAHFRNLRRTHDGCDGFSLIWQACTNIAGITVADTFRS